MTSPGPRTVPHAAPFPIASTPHLVLTTYCPDTTGIVAAVAGFLAARNALITEAQHYDDPLSSTSFMRTVFHDNGNGLPSLPVLDQQFAAGPGVQFKMTWQFHEVRRRCRTVIAVSRYGHCLNSILHRWSTGTLPVEVVGVVSNHQDMRGLSEWHGVPYYYFPIIDQRKAEQEQHIFDLFDRTESELLVLARYMQILSPQACRISGTQSEECSATPTRRWFSDEPDQHRSAAEFRRAFLQDRGR